MKQKLINFMSTRYGLDSYSRFLTVIAVLIMLLAIFMPGGVRDILYVLALAVLIYAYFRVFSKNRSARSGENAKYQAMKQRIKAWFKLKSEMWKQRKEYRFFKCPSCKAVLRVPKGKGKLRVVCKKCGTAFEKKT